jgi:hypothetical protein
MLLDLRPLQKAREEAISRAGKSQDGFGRLRPEK